MGFKLIAKKLILIDLILRLEEVLNKGIIDMTFTHNPLFINYIRNKF